MTAVHDARVGDGAEVAAHAFMQGGQDRFGEVRFGPPRISEMRRAERVAGVIRVVRA